MIKKEMIDYFGVTRKTLNNWENDPESKRYILYRTLEALPLEYVKSIMEMTEKLSTANADLLDNRRERR